MPTPSVSSTPVMPYGEHPISLGRLTKFDQAPFPPKELSINFFHSIQFVQTDSWLNRRPCLVIGLQDFFLLVVSIASNSGATCQDVVLMGIQRLTHRYGRKLSRNFLTFFLGSFFPFWMRDKLSVLLRNATRTNITKEAFSRISIKKVMCLRTALTQQNLRLYSLSALQSTSGSYVRICSYT